MLNSSAPSEHSENKSREVHEISQQNVEKIARIQREAEASKSFSQRVTTSIAKGVGSWIFLGLQSLFFSVWVILNVARQFTHWDSYPFDLLNLALSLQAASIGPIILMSQKWQARLADDRNHLALQVALLVEQEDTETLRLLRKVCERLNIPLEEGMNQGLEQITSPETLLKQIQQANENLSS